MPIPVSSIEEDNFFGKITSGAEPGTAGNMFVIARHDPNHGDGWQASSGYAAVWATENTREAILMR